MNKIKILHIGLSKRVGGIENFIKNIYDNLNKEKFEFSFIAYEKNAALQEYFENKNCKVYILPSMKHILKYIKELKEIIKNNQINIVHIHKNSFANIVPLIVASKIKGVKVILHSHNTASNYGLTTDLLHYINRLLFRKKADKNLACSQLAAYWMFGKKDNVSIVKNGICIDSYKFNEKVYFNKRRELGIQDNEIVICHIGRFVEQKNHEFLVEVIDKCVNKNQIKVILIGKGPLETEIKKKIKKKGMESNYLFLGERQDVAELCIASDLYVFPSLYEGLPISVVEAQASGMYCLVSDKITKEIMITNNIKRLSLDEKIWGEAIDLWINKFENNALNERSSVDINLEYDVRNSAKQIMKIYEQVLKG